MKRINSLTLLIATLLMMISCAEEAATPSNGKSNQQEPSTNELTAFVEDIEAEEDATPTRTTAEYFDNDGLNRGLHFYWTEGDQLWVNNGGTLIQDVNNNISNVLTNNTTTPGGVQRAAQAKFYFNGTFTANSYPVRYAGKNNSNPNKITIKAQQTQTFPNDASHIAESGDCGVAIATKPTGSGRYSFTLTHAASYITFLPYSTQNVTPFQNRRSFPKNRIYKIKVSADQAICGQFDFNDNGLDVSAAKRPAATAATKSIELILNQEKFRILSASHPNRVAATMVIAPGSYTNFTVEYTIKYYVSYASFTLITITKRYPGTVTFIAGKNKKVSQNLQLPDQQGLYYMWDAQQEYWFGHRDVAGNPDGNYAQNNSDVRWYSEIGYPTAASRSCVDCPNLNEFLWYTNEGAPHWDNSRPFVINGHVYFGGMWFKKLSKIAAEHGKSVADLKTAFSNGVDYTTSLATPYTEIGINNSIIQGRPNDNEIDDYFFLPALGRYVHGIFRDASRGFYWSSTPDLDSNGMAWGWHFNSSYIAITNHFRYDGNKLWKADDSDNQYQNIGK